MCGLLSSPPFGEFFLNAAVLRGRKVKREEYGGSDEAARGLGALRRMKRGRAYATRPFS